MYVKVLRIYIFGGLFPEEPFGLMQLMTLETARSSIVEAVLLLEYTTSSLSPLYITAVS